MHDEKNEGGGDERSAGESVKKERKMFPAIISALIGPLIHSPPIPTPIRTIDKNESDLHNDNSVIKNKQNIGKINNIEILRNIETPSQLSERCVSTYVPTEIGKKIADVVRNFLAFIRLVAFRGNAHHSSGLEYLSVGDIINVGLQMNTLTVDVVLGQLIVKIFQFDSTYGIDFSNRTSCTMSKENFTTGQNLFSSILREEFIRSLIATVAGEIINMK